MTPKLAYKLRSPSELESSETLRLWRLFMLETYITHLYEWEVN